jgi:hypothetical protein
VVQTFCVRNTPDTIGFVRDLGGLVRIHVERAIQRIKTFHLLDGEEILPMKDIAEQIFTICAYLVNLQSPIVEK